MEPIIQVENLKYRYPHTKQLALKGIDFHVNRGEFIGIIGANKAGKSTLTQALVGLVPQFYKGAYGGSVIVNGKRADQTSPSELCKTVGLVFQNPFNQLTGAKETVYEEIAFGLQNLGIPKEEMVKRIDSALELLDIQAYKDRNPFDLSGGQMQRVSLASILVMEPEILLLDEPTSQLDPAGTKEVFDSVLKLARAGKTIIMVEQKMELLAEYCDKLLLLKDGEVIAFDTPEVVFSRDDIEELGVLPPVYTQVARKYGITTKQGTYPVTMETLLPYKEILQSKQYHVSWKTVDKNQSKPVFSISNLDFAYLQDKPILSDYNLQLDGRATAIIGQNGAGKTTLVKLLKGLLKPQNGQILYGDIDIKDMTVAKLAAHVGYVFQNPDDQIFKYKVLDEVMFGPFNIGMTKEQAKEQAMKALETVELSHCALKNPYDLELAERKMVAIASVIAMNPQVIILDEPTIAQDYHGKKIIQSVIQKLKAQGVLVIAILHDMDFVAESFERVIVMAQGKILADGMPKEVFAQSEVLKCAKVELPHELAVEYQLYGRAE